MPRRASGYAYEPKWDGFRALLCSERSLQILSRRRWNKAPLLPELQRIPVRVCSIKLIARVLALNTRQWDKIK